MGKTCFLYNTKCTIALLIFIKLTIILATSMSAIVFLGKTCLIETHNQNYYNVLYNYTSWNESHIIATSIHCYINTRSTEL